MLLGALGEPRVLFIQLLSSFVSVKLRGLRSQATDKPAVQSGLLCTMSGEVGQASGSAAPRAVLERDLLVHSRQHTAADRLPRPWRIGDKPFPPPRGRVVARCQWTNTSYGAMWCGFCITNPL